MSLERFRLRGMDHGSLTGLSIAVHAIPDAFLLMHCGVGCKHKATTQLSTHDRSRSVVERACWTEVGDRELIRGSADRIGPYVRSWIDRLDPALLVVSASTFLTLSGEDYRGDVERASTEGRCRVVWVPTGGDRGDLYSGYADAVAAVVETMDWRVARTEPDQVAVLGYLFDRYEGDRAGDLLQLRTLLRGIGLSLGPVLLSGAPLGKLSRAPEAGVLVSLPHVASVRDRIARATGRTALATDLPVGIAGTSAWIEQVGAAAGVSSARIEKFVSARETETRRTLKPVLPRLGGMRVAVFAETPLAVGLVGLLSELGVEPVLVGLRGLGDREDFHEALARQGTPLPDTAEVLHQPSLHAVRDRARALLEAGRLDGLIGSSIELNAVSTLPVESFLAPGPEGHLEGAGPFVLETGFPCRDFHPLRPTPTFGYGGVVAWADRLLGAPRLWQTGRFGGRQG